MAQLSRGSTPAHGRLLPMLLLVLLASSITVSSVAALKLSRQDRRQRCLRDIQMALADQFSPFLSNYTGKTAILDVASLRDLGDTILALGAKRVFLHYETTPGLMCGLMQDPQRHVPVCQPPRQLLLWSGPQATFFWHGGSNFGDLFWSTVHGSRIQYLQELESLLKTDPQFAKHNVTVVQLGTSVYYQSEERLAADAAVLKGFSRMRYVLQTRQPEAYDMVRDKLLLPDVRERTQVQAELQDSIDMVYAIGHVSSLWQPTLDVLLFIRQRSEHATEVQQGTLTKDAVQQIARQNMGTLLVNGVERQVTFDVSDWLDERADGFRRVAQPVDLADLRLQSSLKALSQGRVLITNRLHASVLAMLADIPCFWFDGQGFAKGYSRLSGINSRAWSSSPEHCQADYLRSWHVPMPVDGTPEQEESAALAAAVQQAYKYLQGLAAAGEL